MRLCDLHAQAIDFHGPASRISQVSTPSQKPYVGFEPKLQGQPIAQLHKSHQSPLIRQSGTVSAVVIDGVGSAGTVDVS